MKLGPFALAEILDSVKEHVAEDGYVRDTDLRDLLIPHMSFPTEKILDRWITRQLDEFMASIRFANGERQFRAVHVEGVRLWVTPNEKLPYELSEATAGRTEIALYGNIKAINQFRIIAASEALKSSNNLEFDPNFKNDLTIARQEEILGTWGPILQLNLYRTAL